jgi:hypothetical protein
MARGFPADLVLVFFVVGVFLNPRGLEQYVLSSAPTWLHLGEGVRVLPRHPQALSRFLPGLIVWAAKSLAAHA